MDNANADARFKQMILDAEFTDVICTNKVSGIGTRFLKESLIGARLDWSEGAHIPEATIENEEKMIAWCDIWTAGQGVGLIRDLPAATHLAPRLKADYAAALAA